MENLITVVAILIMATVGGLHIIISELRDKKASKQEKKDTIEIVGTFFVAPIMFFALVLIAHIIFA